MADQLSVDDLVTQLEAESADLLQEAERVLLSDPVPTCPQWSVRELVEHLGGVHHWAAAIVGGGLLQNPSDEEQAGYFAPPDRPDDLLAWFADGASELVATLRAAPDDLQAFVFLKQAPPARLFWARRQAHETTIHRVDVLSARLGRMPSTAEAGIPPEIALDGIDELVTGFVPRRSSKLRTDEPFVMVVKPTDTDLAWTIAVSDQPPVTSHGADPRANAVLSGTAAALYLALWNRGDDIAENGTVEALGHWRDQVRVSWA